MTSLIPLLTSQLEPLIKRLRDLEENVIIYIMLLIE